MEQASQPRHTTAITAILIGATFLSGLDLFIVNVAFDEIGRDFSRGAQAPSLGDLSWILNGYAVVFAALLIPAGSLASAVAALTMGNERAPQTEETEALVLVH